MEPVGENLEQVARASASEIELSRAANEYTLRGWTFTDPVDDVRMAFKAGAAFRVAPSQSVEEARKRVEAWMPHSMVTDRIPRRAREAIDALIEAVRREARP